MRLITFTLPALTVTVVHAAGPANKRRRIIQDEAASTTGAPSTTTVPSTTIPSDAVAADPAPVNRHIVKLRTLREMALNPNITVRAVRETLPSSLPAFEVLAAYKANLREIVVPLWFHRDAQMLVRYGMDQPNMEYAMHFEEHLGHIEHYYDSLADVNRTVSTWMHFCNETLIASLPVGFSAPCVQRNTVVTLSNRKASSVLARKFVDLLNSTRHNSTQIGLRIERTPAVDTAAYNSVQAVTLAFLANDLFVTDQTILARLTQQGVPATLAQVRQVRLAFLWWTAQPSWLHDLLSSAVAQGISDIAFPVIVEEILARAPAGGYYTNRGLAEAVAITWLRYCFSHEKCQVRQDAALLPASAIQPLFQELLQGFPREAPAPRSETDVAQLLLSLRNLPARHN